MHAQGFLDPYTDFGVDTAVAETVFTARRYASAVYAMALCLFVCVSVCVCLSQVGVLLKRLNGLS